MNSPGTVVLSGSTDKIVRLWDPRQNQNAIAKNIKFLGHSDMIRCIVVNEEGTRVTSFQFSSEISS